MSVVVLALLAACLPVTRALADGGVLRASRPLRVGLAERCTPKETKPLGDYVWAITEAGHTFVDFRHTTDPKRISEMVSGVDVVMFSGAAGGDSVNPAIYGQRRTHVDKVGDTRDAWEGALLREAIRQGKGVVGICRGCQFINAAMGGTLCQSIPDLYPENVGHGKLTNHVIRIEADSRLAGILGTNAVVNSWHALCVECPAPHMRIVARTADGIPEAIEHETLPIVACQFHPEVMLWNKDKSQAVFQMFVQLDKWLGLRPAEAAAGTLSSEFVRRARAAYPADPMCRTTVVTNWHGPAVTNEDTKAGVVRWVRVRGVRNLRDIGGWTGLPQGKVYRGAQIGTEKKASYDEVLDEAGRRCLRDELGIRTELDLRGPDARVSDGTSDLPPDASVIGPKTRRVNVSVGSYMDIYGYKRPKDFADALRVFAKAENYPVFVHCAGGADRTGTVCFLLETLCGVPVAEATAEYELTTFSPVQRRTRNRESVQPFALMVRTMTTFPGETFADKVAYWAERVAGLTREEIAAIRRNLAAENLK